jgi:regulator of protease activity HflC (stomatin/prohibitin superfamily)
MNEEKINGIVAVIVIIVVIAICTALTAFTKVGAGERGVYLNWGAVQEGVLDEGLHFKIPIYQQIKVLDVKTVKHEVESEAASSDVQIVKTTVALNYHLDPNNVGKLWQEIGSDYQSRIIDPAIQESVKAATAKFTAQDLIAKRPELKNAIKEELSAKFDGKYIIVDDFSIVNFEFSKVYDAAIEQKQVAEQNALKAENDLKKVEFEAAQRVATATAEAEAIRIQAEAITSQGGREYVNLKAIEKWSGILPTQMIPGGTVPFINLGM